MLTSLAELYVRGAEVDWAGFDKDYPRRKVSLPTYPFQRKRYWLTESKSESAKETMNPFHLWEKAIASGKRQSRLVPIDLQLHTYRAKWESLDSLSSSYIIRAFRKLGAYSTQGEAYSVDGLLTRLGILPAYRKLMSLWLVGLRREGYFEKHDDTFMNTAPLPDPPLNSQLREARAIFADIPFLLEYVERCGDSLSDVITGEEKPTGYPIRGRIFRDC